MISAEISAHTGFDNRSREASSQAPVAAPEQRTTKAESKELSIHRFRLAQLFACCGEARGTFSCKGLHCQILPIPGKRAVSFDEP